MAASTVRHVDMGVGESVRIDGGRIVVTLEQKSGRRARLAIAADSMITVEPPGLPKVARHAMRGVTVPRT